MVTRGKMTTTGEGAGKRVKYLNPVAVEVRG